MEGLSLQSIPQVFLCRILLQLFVIPQHLTRDPHFDLLGVLQAGLQEYGSSSNLDGLLTFCCRQAIALINSQRNTKEDLDTWKWANKVFTKQQDWDDVLDDIHQDIVGLRVQLASETVREKVELKLCVSGTSNIQDDRFIYQYHGRAIPNDSILWGTLQYLQSPQSLALSSQAEAEARHQLEQLIECRLERFARERYETQQHGQSSTNHLKKDMLFDLMGVLMIRNTSMQSSGFAADAWCLYMRDYIEDVSGSAWRVLHLSGSKEYETKISSQQALADISNTPVKTDNQSQVAPSETSLEFHPVYLFYCNEDLTNLDLSQRTEHANSSNSEITFEDYTFDDDEHVPDVYQQQYEEEDDTVCKHCGIAETADDINTIFFCDECNAGVHMLCEDPPISKYEFDIDPWYCRACSRRKGLPLPQPPLSDSLGIKRKHEETS